MAVKGGKRLGSHGGDRRSEGAKEQGAISTLKTRGSTQADYILARLERDRPDILKESPDVVRIVQGEVPLMPTNSESKIGNQNAVKNDGDNITVVSERTRGTDPTYLLARMKGEPTRTGMTDQASN